MYYKVNLYPANVENMVNS